MFFSLHDIQSQKDILKSASSNHQWRGLLITDLLDKFGFEDVETTRQKYHALV